MDKKSEYNVGANPLWDRWGSVLTMMTGICFMLVGPGLIVMNKEIMGRWNFPYPIMVSNLGVTMSMIFSRCMVAMGFLDPPTHAAIQGSNYYLRVMPIGLAHAATLMLGNWVYLYLDMGFIQMLKAFSPVVVLLCQVLLGIGRPATRIIVLSLTTISIGTCITCTGNAQNWSVVGLSLMFVSMIMEGVRLALTQYLLQDLRFNVLEGLYVMSPASFYWLTAASLLLEVPRMNANVYGVLEELWPMLVMAGTMGVCVNFVSYFLIQLTSSLTLKVVATIRNIIVVLIGIMFFEETVTQQQATGYFIALVGFISYQLNAMGMCSAPTPKSSPGLPSAAGARDKDVSDV